MSDLTITPSTATTRYPALRTAARWMVSFLGFPLGGFAATLVVGAVDNLTAALIGGLITGTILGAAQSWAMGRGGPPALQWIAATAIGLTAGFGVGSSVVDYHTSLAALIVQGAISGLAVGIAQALVLRHRLGRLALGLAGRIVGRLGARLGRHHLHRHRGRPAVHRLRRQWCTGRHRPDRRPPADPHPESSERIMTRHVVFGTGEVGRPLVEQLLTLTARCSGRRPLG